MEALDATGSFWFPGSERVAIDGSPVFDPADGTRVWSLMQLERQLRPEVYGRAGEATSTVDGPRLPMHSRFGEAVPGAKPVASSL
jgi:hypothetical protein